MREIYQMALRTIVWLSADPDVETGLMAVQALAQRQESLSRSQTATLPSGFSFTQSFDFGLIIGLPYFQRVWIIQEKLLVASVPFLGMIFFLP